MTERGVFYVARGKTALHEAMQSLVSMHQYNHWPVMVSTDQFAPMVFPETWSLPLPDGCDPGGRLAKLMVLSLCPPSWRQVLYIDADTRVRGDLSFGFKALDSGWDMVIAPSQHQGQEWLWHINWRENFETELEIVNPESLALQAGLFWIARNPATVRFMRRWRCEWERHRDQDMGALLRALYHHPIKVLLAGGLFNGQPMPERVVDHRFGTVRNSK